ncbi:MAG: M4 family metallopeptidase [Gemmatimonadales bacterium]
MSLSHAWCSILPPHILSSIAEKGTARQRELARRSIEASDRHRAERRAIVEGRTAATRVQAPGKSRVVFDGEQRTQLPGRQRRVEGAPATGDAAVDEAYDGSGHTYDLYHQVYSRTSLDDNGMRLDSTVHYGQSYDNAFWNGQQMVYGDGDEDLPEAERLFNRFTVSLEIIGHELTHGVVQFTAGLAYQDQPGALNESFADVFGVLVKQRRFNQTAAQADWLVGSGLFTRNVRGEAIRSLKAPGTAYDDPVLGKDPQPAHMRDYQNVTHDNGGVHINSGIPNHAFYRTALAMGGSAWEKAGRIWYQTLAHPDLGAVADFQRAASLSFRVAGTLYGDGGPEQQAVRQGWSAVGIEVSSQQPPGKKGCVVALATLGLVP